jgi:hypothetical protein
MNDATHTTSLVATATPAAAAPPPLSLPLPRLAIAVRPGVLGDVPFLDALQRLHTKQVGWMPTRQLEAKVGLGQVLVAEEVAGCQLPVASCQLPVASCQLPVASCQ